MRRRMIIWMLALAAFAVAGCTIEPPLHLRRALNVIVKVLWKAEVYPDGIKPTGVTLYIFRDGEFYQQHITASVDSCTLHLEPGKYKLYMISQSPDEYAWMEFSNMESMDSAKVTVLETRSSWFTRADDDEPLIGNPEMMTVGVSDEFEITAEMLEEFKEATTGVDEETADELVRYYTIRVPVNPQSIVSQYWISVYSENADLLKAVRASTSGMARSFNLTKDQTGPDTGTQLITQWKLIMDDPINRVGHIDGIITTFGFPNGEMPSPDRDPSLNIATLLADNSTVENYVFQVGNLITAGKPPDGYRALYRLILGSVENPVMHPPDVRPATDASGMDAVVSEWEDGETVEIDM